jgi:hypothetical protein
MTEVKTGIKDLIARSSLGEGMSWSAFGGHLKGRRIYYQIKVSLLSRISNISMGRILEIEAGAPPFASVAEVRAIASAIGLDSAILESMMPR